MSDTNGPQPTQEEIEAYYAQMREAPIGEILMQCIGLLAGAAEAKLGRRDARTAIDAMAAMVQLGEGHLGEVAEQLQEAVAQLQVAQVQVEKQMQAEGAGTGEAAPGDTAGDPQPEPAAQTPPSQSPLSQSPPSQTPPAEPQTSKLWTPGR